MAANVQVSTAELRAGLVGLAFCCPVDRCNPKDCPLYLLRKLPVSDRLIWIDSLDRADMEFLTLYHRVCMGLKLDRKCSAGTGPS